jgi:phage head maturation protease
MSLVTLSDGRPGLRSLLQVEVRDAAGQGDAGSAGCSAATLDFIASTATLDRYHEIIEPAGWRLDSYRRNPVFQNAHNYGDILFTLGRALSTEVRAVGGGQALCQRIEFATEVNPVARIAYGLYRGGFLNAVSVGFIPLRWEDGSSAAGAQSGAGPRRRYLEQELLEVSAVAIPANPDALALGLKSGAIVKSDLQATLDLLRVTVETPAAQSNPQPNPWLDLARELRRVMRRA